MILGTSFFRKSSSTQSLANLPLSTLAPLLSSPFKVCKSTLSVLPTMFPNLTQATLLSRPDILQCIIKRIQPPLIRLLLLLRFGAQSVQIVLMCNEQGLFYAVGVFAEGVPVAAPAEAAQVFADVHGIVEWWWSRAILVMSKK